MTNKNLILCLSTLSLLSLLVGCGSSPKEQEEDSPPPPTVQAPVPDLSTEIDGKWFIVGYQDSVSKTVHKLGKNIAVDLLEGKATLKFARRRFTGTYVLNKKPVKTIKFSYLSPSSTKESEDSKEKFIESFLSDSFQKSNRYRLNGRKLSLISSGTTLYLEK